MINHKLLMSLCFTFIGLLSCQTKRELTLSELKAYALDPKHGLYKQNKSDDVLIELIHRPKDIMIEQFIDEENHAMWDSIEAELKGYDYFLIRFSKGNKEIETQFAGNTPVYAAAVNYLAGGISKDIEMSIANEAIGASDVMFAPSYGMASASSVLLVFKSDLESRKSDFKVTFDDTQFGTGTHEFEFSYNDLKNVPRLKKEL